MYFRFTLAHPILGELEISEPDGWKDAKLILERDETFGSVIERYEGNFMFYGDNGSENGGADFIRTVESFWGVDAEMTIKSEYSPDGYEYDLIFTGQLDLSTLREEQDNKLFCAIIPFDFWSKFINRYETDVNVQSDEDLDGNVILPADSVKLQMTSQYIRSQTIAHLDRLDGSSDAGYQLRLSGEYSQIDWPTHEVSEITDEYSLLIQNSPVKPVSKFIMEYPGTYRFEIITDVRPFGVGASVLDYAKMFIEFDDEAPIEIPCSVVRPGSVSPVVLEVARFQGDVTHTFLNAAGRVKIYLKFDPFAGGGNLDPYQLFLLYDNHQNDFLDFYTYNNIKVTGDTVYQTTTAETFFMHDIGGAISDRVTGTSESFYSEYLGSTKTKYREYDDDGCQWHYILAQGLQVRGYSLSERQYSTSMKKWFDGVHPHFNVGLGYEKDDDGNDLIRVEDRVHFFDSSDTSIDLPNIRNITREYDESKMYKVIKNGSKKWQSETTSGLDDPQTKQHRATILKRTGIELVSESEFIAASLATEYTRRKTKQKSEDYKFDNDTFIVSVNPNEQIASPETSPDTTVFIPELDENFTSITGLLNKETRYNTRLTPDRAFLRHLPFWSGTLFQYPSSNFKFTYGEGNYKMNSTIDDACEPNPAEISGNSNISPVTPVHLPLDYEMTEFPLDWDEYRTIRDNKKKAIGISQTSENFTKFFIKKLEYTIATGMASLNAWPVTFMPIRVIDGTFPMPTCVVNELADGCYRVTDQDEYRVTEDGDYRVTEDCD